jgi:hypothetical protein
MSVCKPAMRGLILSIPLIGAFLFLLTISAWAQLRTGTFWGVVGVVKDTSGAAVLALT